MKTRTWVFMLLSAFWLGMSCSSTKPLSRGPENSLEKVWDNLDLQSQHHTGLSVYDLDKDNWIFNYREDNYFTPASCTKLLTMYTVLHYMDDFIPAAYYKLLGDTMVVWGGGDPGTLYPDIHATSPFVEFLKSTDKTIVFSNTQFMSERFGAGWAWDDYPYNFQCERTAFPIYGNRLWIDRKEETISVTPRYFHEVLTVKKDTAESKGRNEWGNSYFYNYKPTLKENHVTIPITFFQNDTRLIWSDALGKDIAWKDIPLSGNVSQVKGTERDSLLKWMMQQSDNFIAEQLLLACAMKQTGKLNESDIINIVLKGPLVDLPDSIQWVDGSGLSRYNMNTPRSLVWILRQIIKQKGLDFVKSILPAGGQSGTIMEDYKGNDGRPYIFAKSGTLRDTYNLSGILVTNSGKVLLFSWLNNQFHGDEASLKLSMEHLFNYLRDNY